MTAHVKTKSSPGRVLGVRAEPRGIHWALVTGRLSLPVLEASESASAPRAYGESESLAWIRQTIMYVIETHRPIRLAVRFAERNAKSANTDSAKWRCRVEGVVIEAASARNLDVVTGALNTFAKHSHSESAKDDLVSDDLRGLDWSHYGPKLREAVLVAASLLPEE